MSSVATAEKLLTAEAVAVQLLTAEAVAVRWSLYKRDGTPNANAIWRLGRAGKLKGAEVRLGRAKRYCLAGIEAIEAGGGTENHEGRADA